MRARLILAALLLGGTAGLAPARTLTVGVSIPPQAYLVERIAGPMAEIVVMVEPGYEPETYEPRPSQLAALSDADLYLAIGVPFERVWLGRIRELNPDLEIVQTQHGLDLLDGDPHVWTAPPAARRIAANICAGLARARPGAGTEIDTACRAVDRDLDRLDEHIRNELAPFRGRTVLVYHPAWSHYAAAYGLRQLAIEHDGKEPGPAWLATVIERARRERLVTVFVQPQIAATAARRVAEALDARLVTLDPLARDYPANLRRVTAEIKASLQ